MKKIVYSEDEKVYTDESFIVKAAEDINYEDCLRYREGEVIASDLTEEQLNVFLGKNGSESMGFVSGYIVDKEIMKHICVEKITKTITEKREAIKI